MSTASALPAPTPSLETRPFWEGCREGELRGQVCQHCGATQLYPRLQCVACGNKNVLWEPLSGRAKVVTYTIVRRPVSQAFRERVPFVLAVVRLDEGPQLMTHVVDCDPDAIAIGMRVTVRFEPRGDIAIPIFAPA